MRLLRELSRCLLGWNTLGVLGRWPQLRWIAPKKRPASVDLQASKKSKGLQEQQSPIYFNTPPLHSLTISMAEFSLLTPNFLMNMRLWASTAANDNWQGHSLSRLGLQELQSKLWPYSANKESKNSVNSLEKRSNRMAKFAGASYSILFRASHISGCRRQFPLRRRFSSPHFPRAPALCTSAAN
jgi:hypothetical protein